MNRDRIIDSLNLRSFGQKNWLSNSNISCWNSNCNRAGKVGILMEGNSNVVHCFYCGEAIPLRKFLKKIDRSDLIDEDFEISLKEELTGIDSISILDEDLGEIDKPIGFERIFESKYLESRKFNHHHYNIFKPGKSQLEPGLTNDHIIFQIFQNHKLVGWVARSNKDYEWHKENLRKHEEENEYIVLRYRNSNSEFGKILGGYDEITDETEVVIIVEGLFDKVSVDSELNLNVSPYIKCVFTFGNKITSSQINLLKSHKNIQKIFLLYDYNTIYEMKKSAMMLSNHYEKVRVCEIKGEKDPGEMNAHELLDSLQHSKNVLFYFLNRL